MRKHKQHILYIIVILLSLVSVINTNNTSALSYQSNVGVGFTFNPTLSISFSSNDLVISNLVPGSIEDSNSINVSVATNAAYGYTLSANVGDDIHNNSNLTHTNNTDIFSSIAIDADLASLDTDNTWGYTSKLSNETTWNNYNGLSSSSNAILLDNNNMADSTGSVDFKIAAKASSTQPSGTYTNTINFIAVTKVAPMSLLDSFIASGAEQLNGYYKMQDMTHDICNNVDIEESELQLIDVRDNKVYWVAKLKDGNCWMTQNLDLDLDSSRTYTHWDTDLGWSTDNGNTVDENASWKPNSSTINFDGATTNQVVGWVNSNIEPYSANPGDIYYYTSNSEENDIKYNSLQVCTNAGHNDCAHYHAGNYYNWSATVASNDADSASSIATNSICPREWRLSPAGAKTFGKLLYEQGIILNSTVDAYTENGFIIIRKKPTYLIRSGGVWGSSISFAYGGLYWSSNKGQNLAFNVSAPLSRDSTNTSRGLSVRCLAR